MYSSATKNTIFTTLSVALGIYAQLHKTHTIGPIFDPILAACTEPHDSVADFAKATGHQPYDPAAGLGIFTPIVCVVTQFMYQLRNIYPEGFLTWGLAIVGVLPFVVIATISRLEGLEPKDRFAIQLSWEFCTNCWACQLAFHCSGYQHIFRGGGMDQYL